MDVRRKRRWRSVLFALGTLAVIIGGICYFFWPQVFALIEDELIYARKAKHWATYSTGTTLQGTPDLSTLKER